MKKTVISIGCSLEHDYAFLAPLTCLFWRDLIGYHPKILLVGTQAEWEAKQPAVIQALMRHNITFECVGRISGYPDATIAQNIRQHITASIQYDRWVMTADADLWPLKTEFYHRHEIFPGRAVCLYSNGDHFQGKTDVLTRFDAGGGFQSIPTCHVAMRAKDWREIYDIQPDDTIIGATHRTLEKMKPWLSRCADQGLAKWCCDQWYITERLCRQPWFPDKPIPHPCPPGGRMLESEHVLLVERYGHPPFDRLDRSMPQAWQGPFKPEKWTDAHLPKNPHGDEQWKTILPLIEALLPQHATWAEMYRNLYVNVKSKNEQREGEMGFAIRDAGGIEVTPEDAAYGERVVICGEWDSKHNTVNLAKRCIEDGIPGDFVECGINAGGQPALMGYALRRYGTEVDRARKIHLFDSFEGQPQASIHDCEEYQRVHGVNPDPTKGIAANHFIATIEQVQENMRKWDVPLDQLVYHKGWVQEVIPLLAASFPAIALLRVDVDLHDSTLPIFEHLYEKVSPGGYIISDDWGQYPLDAEPQGCRKAALSILNHKGIKLPPVTPLPRANGTVWWQKP